MHVQGVFIVFPNKDCQPKALSTCSIPGLSYARLQHAGSVVTLQVLSFRLHFPANSYGYMYLSTAVHLFLLTYVSAQFSDAPNMFSLKFSTGYL